MDERDEVENKVREAVEAAVQTYSGDRQWLDWAEAWLSTRDRTYLAALHAAFLIPGTKEFFAAIQGWFQKAGELNAEGHQTDPETFENAMAEQVGQFERVLPRLMDREAARSQAAAGSAFWSAMSAFFVETDRSEEARICAGNSIELCEMLREDDDNDD